MIIDAEFKEIDIDENEEKKGEEDLDIDEFMLQLELDSIDEFDLVSCAKRNIMNSIIPFALSSIVSATTGNVMLGSAIGIVASAVDNNLNSSGKPKNPPSADPLPDHDILVEDIKPGPFDQHGSYGQAGFLLF